MAVIATAGCTLDRSPQLFRDPDLPLGTIPPTRLPVTDADFGNRGAGGSSTPSPLVPTGPTATIPVAPMQNGGLQCNGVFCPFATDPIRPCCTADDDVTQGAARRVNQCGLDFSASAATYYGKHCWQRDQLGVLDKTCPDQKLQSGSTEPGCCTEQNRCGSLNTTEALGCHYQTGTAPAVCGGAVTSPKTDPSVMCEPAGIFGVRSTVDVSWGGRSGGLVGLTDDGRDKIVIHLMLTIAGVDSNSPGPQGELPMRGDVRPCGVELPPFYSTTLCESYKPIFPNTIWESTKLSKIQLSGSFSCLHPGCIVTMDAKTQLIGIDLSNPEAPWPGPDATATMMCMLGKGVQCFPDHDNDKLPGVTISLKTTGDAPQGTCLGSPYAYKAAPLNADVGAIFGGVRRAERIFLGTRTKLGGSGKLATDCNGGIGAGVAEFVQSRAWGCYVQPGTANLGGTPAGQNETCAPDEALFLDQNMPIYNVLKVGQTPDGLDVTDKSASLGPQFSMVRLGTPGDKVTCADVRAANY